MNSPLPKLIALSLILLFSPLSEAQEGKSSLQKLRDKLKKEKLTEIHASFEKRKKEGTKLPDDERVEDAYNLHENARKLYYQLKKESYRKNLSPEQVEEWAKEANKILDLIDKALALYELRYIEQVRKANGEEPLFEWPQQQKAQVTQNLQKFLPSTPTGTQLNSTRKSSDSAGADGR